MSTFISPEAKQEFRAKVEAAVIRHLGPAPLEVLITHEPFLPWFTLEFNGQTEELDHLEALEWFRERGAKNMDKVNDAINQAFNFHTASITISSPKVPAGKPEESPGYTPKI